MRIVAILGITLALVLAPFATSVEAAGNANPKWIAGTWSSIVTVPPNPFMGNEEDIFLPELDTFNGFGGMITTGAATVLPLVLDGEVVLVSMSTGQGNWEYLGGGTIGVTQWRFVSDALTTEPLGFMMIIVEMTFESREYAEGDYRVEFLELDMMTPILSDGVPVVIEGTSSLSALSVMPL